jgi:DNA-binding PadR family transcriptional regulator
MAKINGDTLRGHVETLALAALERGEAHGFEILRRLRERGQGILELKEGTLYPALYRLEDAGYIRGEWEDNEQRHRGPRRRIYHLTKKGRKELAVRRGEWGAFVRVVGDIVGGQVCTT